MTIEYVIQGVFFTPEGQWRLAVSSSADPNGAWTVYAATMTNGTFPDFPELGISSDKVAQTGDAFTISTNRFKGTEFAVLNKQDLLNGVQTPGFRYLVRTKGCSLSKRCNPPPTPCIWPRWALLGPPPPFASGN